MKQPLIGIINVLKTPGITSHGVVARLRRLLNTRQIGHGGTLDPGATGVLPVLVGRATKLMPYVVEHSKTYRAEMTLGQSTDTQDASGTPIAQAATFQFELSNLTEVISRFVGSIEQIPPMTSAVRYEGKRLYERAHRGEVVDRLPRSVFVKRIEVVDVWTPEGGDNLTPGTRILLEIECSKGTYIRTICHDIGHALGCGAYMSFLVRSQVGPFTLDASHTLEEIEKALDGGSLDSILLPLEAGLPQLPRVYVDSPGTTKLRQGQAVLVGSANLREEPIAEVWENGRNNETVAVIGPNNALVCIGRISKNTSGVTVQPTRVF